MVTYAYVNPERRRIAAWKFGRMIVGLVASFIKRDASPQRIADFVGSSLSGDRGTTREADL